MSDYPGYRFSAGPGDLRPGEGQRAAGRAGGGEFITGHPIEAELLPLSTLSPATAAELIPSKDSPALVYCRSGVRSRQAAEKLVKMGYTQVYNLGSLVGWPYGMT